MTRFLIGRSKQIRSIHLPKAGEVVASLPTEALPQPGEGAPMRGDPIGTLHEQMKQMQVIMYLMPLIFMFVLNSYPAGLTYYYFLSNIVTFGMQWAIRRSVNDEAILAKIEAKKAQPKKQSKFQARLEEMQRQQNLNRSQRRK